MLELFNKLYRKKRECEAMMEQGEDRAAVVDQESLKDMYLTYSGGSEVYGIAIKNVREIVGMQKYTEVAELPAYIKGIINLRGRIIPLIDVRLRFGKPPIPYDDRTCVIVVDIDGVAAGLIVDRVEEVLTIPAESIDALPVRQGSGSRFVYGIGKLSDSVVLLVDAGIIVSDYAVQNLHESE